MLRNDRLYKSMSLDDFMLNMSFIIAKGGLALTGYIQNFNYEKSLPRVKEKSDAEIKDYFIEGVKHVVNDILEMNIDIVDMGKYYDIWTEIKNSATD